MLRFYKVNIKQKSDTVFIMLTMAEAQYEIQKMPVTEQEKPVVRQEYTELKPENFAGCSTELLAALWKSQTKRRNKNKVNNPDPEQDRLFTGVSLELFFRLKGNECRSGYNKWLEITNKKKQEWELQMRTKYGDNWEQYVTETDSRLLTYSVNELQQREIEEQAKSMKKKDIRKLRRKEKKEGKQQMSFFKLVKAKTLEQYQFLGEREVHKAVYSPDFLLFYLRQGIKSMMKRGIRHMRGQKQVTVYQELQRELLEGAGYVKKLVMERREQQMRRTVNNGAVA